MGTDRVNAMKYVEYNMRYKTKEHLRLALDEFIADRSKAISSNAIHKEAMEQVNNLKQSFLNQIEQIVSDEIEVLEEDK